MSTVAFRNITKRYANGFEAVTDLDLDVGDGELLVVVGPSGCGKTTTLRMLAGLEDITEGQIEIDGSVVNEVPARERDIAMVFQSYALYPHLTVGGNLAYPLKLAGLNKTERHKKVVAVARQLRIEALLDRKPRQLSGGQRQRVAMGRAMVRDPKVFLMDEPLSNLDAKLRVAMRAEVSELQRSLGATMFYVTHDQVEAMTMGDRVAVMDAGVLQQVGTPDELYHSPVNVFVAGFIGSPPMNLVAATISKLADGSFVAVSGRRSVQLDASLLDRFPGLMPALDRKIVVGARPEHIQLVEPANDGGSTMVNGEVRLVEVLGSEQIVHVEVRGLDLVDVDEPDTEELTARRVLVTTRDDRPHFRVGENVGLRVSASHLHLFDGETGTSLDALRYVGAHHDSGSRPPIAD
jgi:multiple sugar transport system ATP-binding protein